MGVRFRFSFIFGASSHSLLRLSAIIELGLRSLRLSCASEFMQSSKLLLALRVSRRNIGAVPVLLCRIELVVVAPFGLSSSDLLLIKRGDRDV